MVIARSSESENADVAMPSERAKGTVAVLEWRAWDGFLLAHVLGDDAVRIQTDPFREFPSSEFDRVSDSVSTVCFQINLSVRRRLPLRIRDLTKRFAERGLDVVNGLVQDIRKSTLHAHLGTIGLSSLEAGPTGSPDEILFVKTELNYGGEIERLLPPENIAAGGLEHLISADVGPYYYKTVERGMVQESLWTDPTTVIEKYVTNAENSFYRAYFSGKQVIIVKAFAPGIIKKLSDDPRDTNFVSDLECLTAGTDELPLSARLKRDVATFVEKTPVEFGCIDIVHDGHDHHYIVDLNLTPYAGKGAPDPYLSEFLMAGITCPQRRKPAVSIRTPLA
ncbi:MAG: hypothetical protein QOJ64_3341 [Acidobacteriota bacterium]|jgi:hypothetical protein|nr:hypothetical protein [Acidobacteriota bacterium]